MTVEKLLARKKTGVYSIHSDEPLLQATKLMTEKQIGSLVVLDKQQHLQGIITERDIVRTCAAFKEGFQEILVKEIMTPRERLILSNRENDLRYVMSLMTENNLRHIPIVEGEQVIAVVSMRDLMKSLLAAYEMQLLTEKKDTSADAA